MYEGKIISERGKMNYLRGYRRMLRKPNRYINDAAARSFFPSQTAPKFGFLVLKHKKRRMLNAWRSKMGRFQF